MENWVINTGLLSSLIFEGEELLLRPLTPNFWRAPTDNDFGNYMPDWAKAWEQAGRNRKIRSDHGVHALKSAVAPRQRLGRRLGVVRPGSGRVGRDVPGHLERSRRESRVRVSQLDRMVIARCEVDLDTALKGHGECRQTVIVGVLSNQVDATGRPRDIPGRGRSEVSGEDIDDVRVRQRLPSPGHHKLAGFQRKVIFSPSIL